MNKQIIELKPLQEANNQVKGTNEYNKYYMETYGKTNGKWHFLGWYIPLQSTAIIKKYGEKNYLMVSDEERYLINESVSELLNL